MAANTWGAKNESGETAERMKRRERRTTEEFPTSKKEERKTTKKGEREK